MRLAGKTAIITGGTTGIGRASAVLFAREGASVVVTDWRDDRSAPVMEEIARTGHEGLFVRADVSRREDNERMIDACIERFGKLDILFCNAGRFLPKLLPDSNDEEIESIFAVNVMAPVYASRYAIPAYAAPGRGIDTVRREHSRPRRAARLTHLLFIEGRCRAAG